MPQRKLPTDAISKILEALNNAESVTAAANELSVTRQALRNFMNAHGIERICEYRQTTRSIDIKAGGSAKDDPTSQARSRR